MGYRANLAPSSLSLTSPPHPPHRPPFSPPPPTLLAHICGCLIQSQSFNVICILDSHMSTFGPGLCTESQTFLFSGLLHASLGRASDLLSNLPRPSRGPDLVFAPGPPDALSESVAQAQTRVTSTPLFFRHPSPDLAKLSVHLGLPELRTSHLSLLSLHFLHCHPQPGWQGSSGALPGSLPGSPPGLSRVPPPRSPPDPAVQFSAGRCLTL